MGKFYTFKSFTELSDSESREIYEGRNHEHVRKWMTSEEPISFDEHLNFINTLKSSSSKIYFRVERMGNFAGVYSLNNFQKGGSAIGGFWIAPYARERLLGLNVIYNCIDYVFKNYSLESIQGYQMIGNKSVAKINSALGFVPANCSSESDSRIFYLELKRSSWENKFSQDPRLLELIELMESRYEN